MSTLRKLIYRWISQRFMDGCSHYNTLEVRKSCRSKKQMREVFSKCNIPHARGMVFVNPYQAHRYARKYGFPLVIKPNVSGFSRGSHFPITDFTQLWRAIFLAKLWWPTTVIEQYLEGKNYRVLVIRGKIMSVIERYPPFVDGNGSDTISHLIDKENTVREEMGLFPCMHSLQKGSATVKYLSKSGYNLDSIPPAGKRIKLFHRVALAPGGVVRTVEKSLIPQINNELFLSILDMFDANILGIDVIFEESIEKSFREQQCIFLEVNSRPYLKMHDYPRYGEKEDLSNYIKELDQLEIAGADVF